MLMKAKLWIGMDPMAPADHFGSDRGNRIVMQHLSPTFR
jgi:hypothetical protein